MIDQMVTTEGNVKINSTRCQLTWNAQFSKFIDTNLQIFQRWQQWSEIILSWRTAVWKTMNYVQHSASCISNLAFAVFDITTIHNKPVGFYGPIAPPVPNAPSSECPRASITARCRVAGSIRKSRQASCCCSSANAGIAIRANFKIYLLRQFCSNRVAFLLQYTGNTDAKNNGPEFWNSNSVIFENFFEIFKKASRGPSAADLDHYDGGQTRSE